MSREREPRGGTDCGFVLGCALAGVLLTAGVCSCQPAKEKARRSERPPTKNELRAVAARGQPIVTAMYRFKQERGLWPCSLDELSPDYLKAAQTKGWRLNWHPDGWWQLICYAGFPDWAVRYGHGGNDDGWAITDGVHEELLGVKQPLPPPSKLSIAHLQKNRTRQLRRRIEDDPKRIVHRQALVAFLYRTKDYDAARRVCVECQRLWPEHYWPYLMLARIDAQRGQAAAAAQSLRKWACCHKDFTHYYLLAKFLHERGDKKGAQAALREGAKFPLADLFGSERTGEHLGWGATQFSWAGAMLAYEEGWYDLARQICARWQAFLEKHTRDPGNYAVLAACELAQGQYDEASAQAKRARKVLRGRNYGWTRNFHELEEAIAAKDKTFRYKPRPLELFRLLKPYE